jgi:hypothetical protein
MRRGIGQGIDDLHLFDDRAGPFVRNDHFGNQARSVTSSSSEEYKLFRRRI